MESKEAGMERKASSVESEHSEEEHKQHLEWDEKLLDIVYVGALLSVNEGRSFVELIAGGLALWTTWWNFVFVNARASSSKFDQLFLVLHAIGVVIIGGSTFSLQFVGWGSGEGPAFSLNQFFLGLVVTRVALAAQCTQQWRSSKTTVAVEQAQKAFVWKFCIIVLMLTAVWFAICARVSFEPQSCLATRDSSAEGAEEGGEEEENSLKGFVFWANNQWCKTAGPIVIFTVLLEFFALRFFDFKFPSAYVYDASAWRIDLMQHKAQHFLVEGHTGFFFIVMGEMLISTVMYVREMQEAGIENPAGGSSVASVFAHTIKRVLEVFLIVVTYFSANPQLGLHGKHGLGFRSRMWLFIQLLLTFSLLMLNVGKQLMSKLTVRFQETTPAKMETLTAEFVENVEELYLQGQTIARNAMAAVLICLLLLRISSSRHYHPPIGTTWLTMSLRFLIPLVLLLLQLSPVFSSELLYHPRIARQSAPEYVPDIALLLLVIWDYIETSCCKRDRASHHQTPMPEAQLDVDSA